MTAAEPIPEPQAHEVEALLFDLGGVLFEISFDRALEAWRPMSSLSPEDMRRAFCFDQAYERHERGEMHWHDYRDHLRTTLRLRGSDADIEAGWNAIFLDEIDATLQLVRAVRRRMPCYAFSNSNMTHRATWTAKYPAIIAAFDRVFVSSEIGVRKPEARAFAAVAAAIGKPPGSILFFDDTQENVAGARAAGLQAVHVRGPADVERVLVALLGDGTGAGNRAPA